MPAVTYAILVDGIEKRVTGEGRELHGFIDLFVGPLGPMSRPESRHQVPTVWWQNRGDMSGVRTGGHLYQKVPQSFGGSYA